FRPHAVAEKRNPRGRAASERACFMESGSAERGCRSRKGPPILRASCCGVQGKNAGRQAHGWFSSCLSFCSSCAIAARTDASAVPPATDLEAMALSTEELCRKSRSKKGEIFWTSANESCVQA